MPGLLSEPFWSVLGGIHGQNFTAECLSEYHCYTDNFRLHT